MGLRYVENQADLGRRATTWRSAFRVVYTNYFRRYLAYFYDKYLRGPRYFTYGGEQYRYFYHRYNFTNLNERSVEIAIMQDIISKNKDRHILEVGNVLSHYFKFPGDILDKYEKYPGVINQDAADFKAVEKYDLIVSVSTLEHIGRDDGSRDPDKIIAVLENLRSCLAVGGQLIFTIPIGYNHSLDDYIRRGKISPDEQYFMQRKTKDNQWSEITAAEAWVCRYDFPYRAGNAILIAYFKND
ncbi:MAG: hypothetical protein C3F02_00365 [Parcubacteria group bacterium]|nr:MAG: hypothetical protein C3F02_00365 [Parcubacteria group bacterium]